MDTSNTGQKPMRIDTIAGPWVSFGIHIDFKHRHIDIHFIWWIIVLGNTVEPVHCGYCDAEIDEATEICPSCGYDFTGKTSELAQFGITASPTASGVGGPIGPLVK